jgi:hypothetical protein
VTGAPDLVEPVVGFRVWRVIGERLLSPYIPCRWEGPELHAVCYPANRSLLFGRGWLDEPHPSPHPRCRCGIYAYHRPGVQSYVGEWEWLEGVVTAWGRIEVHADGLRAEHARVEALGLPRDGERGAGHAARAIAARLGVELLPRAELPEAAGGYGAPLPSALVPR